MLPVPILGINWKIVGTNSFFFFFSGEKGVSKLVWAGLETRLSTVIKRITNGRPEALEHLFPWAHLQVIIMLLDLMSHPWESHIPYILSWCIHYTYSLGMAVQRASVLNGSSAATLAPCSWARAAHVIFLSLPQIHKLSAKNCVRASMYICNQMQTWQKVFAPRP